MQKPGRNDLCPCGSKKKYKHCCLSKPVSAILPSLSENRIAEALNQAAGYFDAGNVNEAVMVCQRILQLSPEHSATLNLLGIMAFRVGNLELAINLLKRSVQKNPSYADALNNLGVIYKEQRALNQAASCFERALRINPDYEDALINYGGILQDLQRYDDALLQYRHILTIRPDHAGALSNLGNVLQELNRHGDAMEVFTQLLNIDPEYEYAYGSLVYSRMQCCDWRHYESDAKYISSGLKAGKRICKPFELLPISNSAAEQFSCASIFVEHLYPPSGQPVSDGACYQHSKIRLAYLSADFRQHAVSQLLVEVIEEHDRDKFEVMGFSFGHDDQSELRHRVVNAFDRFIDVSQRSDDEVASLLREMEIDIAIDLMGFTTNARMGIFARKAAPVQVTFLGYAGTTGAGYMDYILADNTVIPEHDTKYYSEKVVRLPGCFQPNDSKRVISSETPTRTTAGLPEHGFVFCAFNNHYKITPQVFDVWMRLLTNIDGSVLWLSQCTPIARQNLVREANSRGVGVERLVFAERTSQLSDHLARHQLADLFLDTLPYNAHTTASDALWAGLPVLTCKGRAFPGRVAASLLHAMELPELITNTLEEYEILAMKLATDATTLNAIRSRLSASKSQSALFNTATYRQYLEMAYIRMCEKHQRVELPCGFDL